MILIRRPEVVFALVLVGAIPGSACSGVDTAPDTGTESSIAFATTSIWADITSNTLCGQRVDPIVPIGADPHTWEPSIRTRGDLETAQFIIANGLDLEEGLTDLLDAVDAEGIAVLYMAEHVEVIDTADEHVDDSHDDHHHADGDPHIWLDPVRVADALPAIVDVAVANGGDRAMLTACADAYANDLRALDADIEAVLASIPAERRVLVTNHDALGYFADRYRFDVVGTVIPSMSTIAEVNAADLADLAAVIMELDIPAIFTDAQSNDVDAQALADRIDGVAVIPLLTGTLTSGRDDGASYMALMRTNAELIASALAL